MMLKSLSILFAVLLVGVVMLRGAGRAGADSVAVPDPVVDAPLAASKGEQTAVLAGGCFWGVEAVFEHVKGVKSVTSGYAGGGTKPARYEAVSSGTTGHAESVRISYDPSRITYGQLLKVFFAVAHDPTELNRQGPDTGTQYRSAIFYASEEQRRIAASYVEQLNRANVFGRPVVTEVSALDSFHPAESYHQDYLALHPDEPYIVMNDLPKLKNLRKQFPQLYVSR
jgi:peptide-methionine (S)-S-oxide reductase